MDLPLLRDGLSKKTPRTRAQTDRWSRAGPEEGYAWAAARAAEVAAGAWAEGDDVNPSLRKLRLFEAGGGARHG